eukprot:Skav222400  [mRNA]  locus=scaffold4422:322994:324573:+ [translate_table: standard]
MAELFELFAASHAAGTRPPPHFSEPLVQPLSPRGKSPARREKDLAAQRQREEELRLEKMARKERAERGELNPADLKAAFHEGRNMLPEVKGYEVRPGIIQMVGWNRWWSHPLWWSGASKEQSTAVEIPMVSLHKTPTARIRRDWSVHVFCRCSVSSSVKRL